MQTFNKILLVLMFSFGSIHSLYSQDSFILNYEDVDIKKVTQDIAQFSKKTIILDPRVKGRITIYSNANLNRTQVWDVYLRTIQVNGFSAIVEDSFVELFQKMRLQEIRMLHQNLLVIIRQLFYLYLIDQLKRFCQ